MFCYGGHTNSAYRLDIRPVITGGVEYLQYQLTGSTTADVGYKKIPTSDMGLKKGMIGQDVRITIGVKLSNINEETGKTSAVYVQKYSKKEGKIALRTYQTRINVKSTVKNQLLTIIKD